MVISLPFGFSVALAMVHRPFLKYLPSDSVKLYLLFQPLTRLLYFLFRFPSPYCYQNRAMCQVFILFLCFGPHTFYILLWFQILLASWKCLNPFLYQQTSLWFHFQFQLPIHQLCYWTEEVHLPAHLEVQWNMNRSLQSRKYEFINNMVYSQSHRQAQAQRPGSPMASGRWIS